MNWKCTFSLLLGLGLSYFSNAQTCDNVTEGGEIGFDQTLCMPGADPDAIANLVLPTGGAGDLEYIWISTTNDPAATTTVWNLIPGSTSESYDPGPLQETTYFRRCARRTGCVQYIGESNIIKICVDEAAPVFTFIPIGGEIDCTEAPVFGTPTFEDDCDEMLDFSFEDEVNTVGCTTEYIRIFSISDECGNTKTAAQVFTTTDDEAPVLSLGSLNDGDVIVQECDNVTLFDETSIGVSDNCDPFPVTSFEMTEILGDCPVDGYLSKVKFSWTAVDACGNTASLTIFIEIVDTTAPEFTSFPADETIDCSETPVFGTPTFEDNCDEELTLETEEETVVDGCTTTYSRTFTVSDDCGNKAIETQTITTVDNEAPVLSLVAPNDAIVDGDTLTLECDAVILFGTASAVAVDNCDDEPTVTFSDTVVAGDCPVDGFLAFYTCTWTAKDNCGNTSTLTVYVKVVDTTNPIFTYIPPSDTIQCLGAPTFGVPTFEDNCDEDLELLTTIDTVANGCSIEYNIIWKVVDDCGNIAAATQTILAIDDEAPVLTLGSIMNGDTLTAECDAIPVFDETSISVADNCDPFPIIDFTMDVEFGDCPTDGYLRIMSRSWTAMDACGNVANFTIYIRVVDTTAPEIALPAPFDNLMDGDTLTAECDNVPVLSSGSAIVTDNCDDDVEVTFADDVVAGDCLADGFIRLYECTYTAKDDCDNISTYTVFIKVVDTTAPEFVSVPADLTIQCDEDPVFGTPTFMDNCDSDLTETIEQDTFYSPCSTEFVRTWTITDDCGNSATATQFIWAIDNVAPSISLNAPYGGLMSGDTLTAECDNVPTIDASTALIADNCDENLAISFAVDFSNADCATEGYLSVTTYTWTASDACGNTTTFQLSLRVVDTTVPQIMTVPDITVASCDDPLVIDGLATAFDNCDNEVEITFSVDTVITAEDIKYQINWVATDDCLNTDDTLQIITVPCNASFSFTNISGTLMNNTVLVDWRALNEDHSGVYALERSKDGVDFNFLNEGIPAEGVIRDYVDYAGWDADPYEGHNYYRVQYVDNRGDLHHSEIIRMELPTTENIKIFPNPTSDATTIELHEFSEGEVLVRLHTRDGMTLREYTIEAGESTLRVEMEDLRSGMYFLTVQGDNTRSHARRIIKAD